MTPALHVRFFLSSPSDCRDQRLLAARVLDDLVHGHEYQGRVYVDAFAYDDDRRRVPMPLNRTPQHGISKYGRASADCHYCLAFFWRHLGTPLPPDEQAPHGQFPSGTAYEIETAQEAGRDVFLYVRTDEPEPGANAEADEQYGRLRAYLDGFKNPDGSLKGSITKYQSLDQLPELLRQHLSGVLRRHLDRHELRWQNVTRAVQAVGGVILAALTAVAVWWQLTRPAIALTAACEPQQVKEPARLSLRLSYSATNMDRDKHQLLARLTHDPEGLALGPRAYVVDVRADHTLVVFEDVKAIADWPYVRMELRSRAEEELLATSPAKKTGELQCPPIPSP